MTEPKRSLTWIMTAVGGACVGVALSGLSEPTVASPKPLPVVAAHEPGDLSRAFRDVAANVLPGVVSIRTESRGPETTSVRDGGPAIGSPEEEMLRRFFGNNPQFEGMIPQMPGRPRGGMPRQQGAGSGFIIDADGIILTNSHVVEGANKVFVTLDSGREVQAESWNFDPRSDVAIVRIKTQETLHPLVLGDSSQMQVGDWVMALGNPFNVGTTVTQGIISATGRGPHINEREEFLQTDAAINPGNSGGPLVNLFGEVIGINTAISTRSGGYDGIGFAIPSNNARWVAEQLIAHKEVKRSYLGVSLKNLTSDLRDKLGVPVGQGALVLDVIAGGPAENSKVQPGDVILEFAGKKIANNDSLVGVVEQSAPGSTYDMVVLRDGNKVTLPVKLEPMPSDYGASLRRARVQENNKSPSKPEQVDVDKLGIQVSELNAELADQLGLDQKMKGVIVRDVKAGTPAEEAGVQTGDVIQRVGKTPVANLAEFQAAVDKEDLSNGVLLYLKRGKGSEILVVKPVK
ncbi:Do family serine endopeptidase [Planctomicrobium sp. SH664]|uniref:Do family serine endopeptidase n=1 Tax=Planctomicrobium sp. SH664 TaxID=3448125 RepID=UPI003F5AE0F9